MDKSGQAPFEAAGEQAVSPRPISITRTRISENTLEQRARQVAAAAGSMVARLRGGGKKVDERDLWKITNPFSDLRTSRKGRTRELRHTVELRAQERRRAALDVSSGLGSRFGEERGTRQMGRNYLIAMAAGAGLLVFLLGMMLKTRAFHHSR